MSGCLLYKTNEFYKLFKLLRSYGDLLQKAKKSKSMTDRKQLVMAEAKFLKEALEVYTKLFLED